MAGEVVSWAENAVCPSTDHDLLMRSLINQDSSWAEYAVCPSTDHDLLTRSFIISRQQLGRECCMPIHRSRPPYEILHNIKTASRPQHTRSTTNFCKAVPQRCFVLKNECLCCRLVSHVQLCATPCTVAQQAPVSAGIFQARILEWVAISSSRDLPDPGIEPQSPYSWQILYHWAICPDAHTQVVLTTQYITGLSQETKEL